MLTLVSAVLKPSSRPAYHQSEGEEWGREDGGVREIPPLICSDSGCLLRGDKSMLLAFSRGMQRD